MDSTLRIVFMGTPEFAVPSLEILVKKGYSVVGVVTAQDKPAGRGLQMQESAVKKYALANNIPVLQPERLKSPDFITELESLEADLQIVVAFRMLPEIVWNMPRLGTINLHGSLLPDYRGAAPINWAIINGEIETGLTTFFLQHEIDTGDIILQEKLSIGENETAGELHDRMMVAGAGLVLKTVQAIDENNVKSRPQPVKEIQNPAPKLFKDNCRIHWNKTVKEVHDHIRGLSPYPAAWTKLDEKIFKIYRAGITGEISNKQGGDIISDGKTYMHILLKDGTLALHEVQLEGKRKMSIEEFLRGYAIKNPKIG
jgi:methionyl-tRNA formyltransferase